MPADLHRLAKRRADLVRQLMASSENLPSLSSGPDRADVDYARNLLAADIATLEGALLAGLADPPAPAQLTVAVDRQSGRADAAGSDSAG